MARTTAPVAAKALLFGRELAGRRSGAAGRRSASHGGASSGTTSVTVRRHVVKRAVDLVEVVGHGSTRSFSWRRPRWMSDFAVPVRQPSTTATSSTAKSA